MRKKQPLTDSQAPGSIPQMAHPHPPIDENCDKPSLIRIAQELQEENQQLRKLINIDWLTQIGNQRAFFQHLRSAIGRQERYGQRVGLILLDIDRFKSVNDEFGHAMGNQLLVGVAEIFREQLRDSDHSSRIGGDEFALIVIANGPETLETITERVRQSILGLADELPFAPSVTFGYGLAEAGESATDYFDRVDKLLLANKTAGT